MQYNFGANSTLQSIWLTDCHCFVPPPPPFTLVNLSSPSATLLDHLPDYLVALFTFLLFFVGWIQLRALRSTAKGEFANKLNGDFFTQDCRTIMDIIDSKKLVFSTDGGAHFELSGAKVPFTTRELDDTVLGPLEAVGIFERRRSLDLPFVYDMFASSIIEVFDCPAIVEYIHYLRQRPLSKNLYCYVEHLNRVCRQFTLAKERGWFAASRWRAEYWLRSFFSR